MTEGYRASTVPARSPDTEAKVLAVADGRELGEAAAWSEQRRCRVVEPERGESAELGTELQGELCATRDDGVDRRHGPEVGLVQHGGGLGGEVFREGFDVLLRDREAGRRAVAAPASEQFRAGAEGGMEVERRNRPAGSLPVTFCTGDEHDR